MFLIAGLGNPGKAYHLNRHNVGFLFLDFIREKYNFEIFKKKNYYFFTKAIYGDKECIFIKPTTYMNLSGTAVLSASTFFKIPKENIIIIYDDTALPFGKIRIRENGSSGGHNGLKSIEQVLGTSDYKRIRLGVSSPVESSMLRDYVLGDFSGEDVLFLKKDVFSKADESLKLIVNYEIKEAMNKFNGNNSGKSWVESAEIAAE